MEKYKQKVVKISMGACAKDIEEFKTKIEAAASIGDTQILCTHMKPGTRIYFKEQGFKIQIGLNADLLKWDKEDAS